MLMVYHVFRCNDSNIIILDIISNYSLCMVYSFAFLFGAIIRKTHCFHCTWKYINTYMFYPVVYLHSVFFFVCVFVYVRWQRSVPDDEYQHRSNDNNLTVNKAETQCYINVENYNFCCLLRAVPLSILGRLRIFVNLILLLYVVFVLILRTYQYAFWWVLAVLWFYCEISECDGVSVVVTAERDIFSSQRLRNISVILTWWLQPVPAA